MQVKIVVIDFEIPARIKRRALTVGIPLAILASAGAVAYASVPHTWKIGDVLSAADLNANFSDLDSRVTSLRTPISARYHLKTQQPFSGEPFPSLGMAVDYDVKDHDSANAVTTGADWQFKAPVDGKYLATASLTGTCATCENTNAFATMRFSINGTWNFDEAGLDLTYDWVGGNMHMSGSDVLVLKANDKVSVRFTENNVGSTFNAGGGAVTFTRISD
ncbi:hypothetical protein WME97_21300 [Sorangium sp. So ce367]|uniref:hypothetical protein n=1 Tax=Sorangium sp. So ce367 TaxID=3133305 RepID=UPI003F5DED45